MKSRNNKLLTSSHSNQSSTPPTPDGITSSLASSRQYKLKQSERVLSYGYTDEKLSWKAANKYQTVDYIEKQQHKNDLNMDKIYCNYFQLLLKTRICILEEDGNCTLLDDNSLSCKERIIWCGKWIETCIIRALITEWNILYDRLEKIKIECTCNNIQIKQLIVNMIQMSKTIINKLAFFEEQQKKICQQLKAGLDYRSRRMMNKALEDINKCLDSYVKKGKCVLMAATKNYSQKIDELKVDNDTTTKNAFFTTFWTIFAGLSLQTQSLEIGKLEKNVQKELDVIYWLLLFNTRSKMKILMTKSMLQKKMIVEFLDSAINSKNELIERLFTFDSTIFSYAGLDEWKAMQNAAQSIQNSLKMSSIIRICKILIKFQNTLKQTQEKVSNNINDIESCQTKERIESILIEINVHLDVYIQNEQNVLNVIESATQKCFDNLN